MGQYQTFVVRLWQDTADEAAHGHIQHIASRRAIYFRGVDRMLAFIRDCAVPEDARAPGGGGDPENPYPDQPATPPGDGLAPDGAPD